MKPFTANLYASDEAPNRQGAITSKLPVPDKPPELFLNLLYQQQAERTLKK